MRNYILDYSQESMFQEYVYQKISNSCKSYPSLYFVSSLQREVYVMYCVITYGVFLLGKKFLEKIYIKIQAPSILGKNSIRVRKAAGHLWG